MEKIGSYFAKELHLKQPTKGAKMWRTVSRKLTKGHTEHIGQLTKMYDDQKYQEVDGIYIIYQGHVDLVDPRKRQKIAEIQMFETFGESKAL